MLNRRQLERLSYILAIYSELHGILGSSKLADAWIHRKNSDFDNNTPLSRMLTSNADDLIGVWSYLQTWREGI